MAKRTAAFTPIGKSRRRPSGRVAAADFKARCLELMDRVRETGAEYVVTKHGKPVAKLVPYAEPTRKAFFGSMKGTVLKYDRPFDPIDGDYDINS
jgi:prevent-host-death family protein